MAAVRTVYITVAIKALVFIVKKTWSGIKKKKKTPIEEKLKKMPLQLLKLLQTYIGFVLMLIILQLILKELNLFPGGGENKYSVYFFVFLFFAYRFVLRFIFKIKILNIIMTLVGSGAMAYLVFSGQTDFLFNIIKIAMMFMLFVGILQKLTRSYIEQKEVKKIGLNDLETGRFFSFQNLDNDLKLKLGKIDKTGLIQEQVEILKDFLSRSPDKEIKAYKTFALAPFMLLGALISVWTNDSFISLLSKVFNFIF